MEYILYTFESTTDAMLAEMTVTNEKIRARLVPLLPEIDAGCGLALRFEKDFDKEVKEIFSKNSLSFQKRYRLIYGENERKPKVLEYDLL
ncbi:MAG: DUF3343 domain-containing protein [Peptoniphilaceae bacterium]|nr:DUF3343 domain-containing protein [Peptoniphilaceae bacterium]MDY6018744.1 DUF3343 domain-containing protein [Anaerococcus sp.]